MSVAVQDTTEREAAARSVPQPISNWYRYYVLGVLFVGYALNFLDRTFLSMLVEPIKRELHVSDTHMGLLTGFAFAVFYTAFGLPMARWADRGNRRSVLALGMAVWSLMTAASGFAHTFWSLALARVGVGIGESTGAPTSHALISDYFPKEQRARALAVFQAAIYLGSSVGYMGTGWVAQVYGWRAAFFAAGIPGLFFAIVVRLTVREPIRGASDSAKADRTTQPFQEVFSFLWRQRAYILVIVGLGLGSFAQSCYAVWSPSFLIRVHHLRMGEIGASLGVLKLVCGVGGTLLGGFVVSHFKSHDVRWTLFLSGIAMLAAAPSLWVFLMADKVTVAFAGYAFAVVLIGFQLGPCFAMAQNLAKVRMRAMAASIAFVMVYAVGFGMGPMIVGILNDLLKGYFGPQAIRYSLAIGELACIIGALCFIVAAKYVYADLANCEVQAVEAPAGA